MFSAGMVLLQLNFKRGEIYCMTTLAFHYSIRLQNLKPIIPEIINI